MRTEIYVQTLLHISHEMGMWKIVAMLEMYENIHHFSVFRKTRETMFLILFKCIFNCCFFLCYLKNYNINELN